jgi:superfamily II DNA or RNA helicase
VSAPVVVASVQILARPNRLAQLSRTFRTIVVDEGHHAVAESYRHILEELGSFCAGWREAPLTVGFTAIPERADRVGLGQVWQKIVYQKSLLEMITARYLSDLRAVRISLKADLDQVHTRHGDFVGSELESALLSADAPNHVVAAYQYHAHGRKALVFTPTVRLAHDMAATFHDAGVAAEALDGTTLPDARRAILHCLHTGLARLK